MYSMTFRFRNSFASMKRGVTRIVGAFHREEDGIEIVQLIAILFIGVLILAGMYAFFNSSVWPQVKTQITNLFNSSQPQ